MAKNNSTKAIDMLAPGAIAVVSLAIVVAVGAVVLGNMQPVSYQDQDKGTEAFQPTSPLPTNITVSVATDADFVRVVEDSEILVYENASTATNTTLVQGTDYAPYYEEGIFEAQSPSALASYNDSEDNLYVTEYSYEYKGAAHVVLGTGLSALQTFANFFTIIVIMLVASVIFLLLRTVRRNGNRGTA